MVHSIKVRTKIYKEDADVVDCLLEMFGDIVYQGWHSTMSATPTLLGNINGIQFLLNVWREVDQE